MPPSHQPPPVSVTVHRRLGELAEELGPGASRVRRHKPGSVHALRVTLRQLRSLLATFAELYDAETVRRLRAELAWLAGELAGARDVEVVRERLRELAVTPEQQAVAALVDHELAEAQAEGEERAVAALDTARYAGLVRAITDFTSDPPWTEAAHDPDGVPDRRPVWQDWKRLRRRIDVAEATPDAGPRRVALHEARKATKRLRYAAATLTPVYGADAARLARRAKRLQTDLGDLQDHAVARQTLRELAARPGRDAHDAFVLGTFHADEDPGWATAEKRYAESWSVLARKKNRRWLR